jgi:tetratricopeptide (TPR) repeat protein
LAEFSTDFANPVPFAQVQAEVAAGLTAPSSRVSDQDRPSVPGFELLRELGRGGMGVVYQARQTGLNRIVALKMILAGKPAPQRLLTRFQTEAEAVARLHHPNIVQIYEVGTSAAGYPYLALEYVSGGALNDYLRAEPLSPERAARAVIQMARAMAHAHTAGVIHRDLKPANVLVQLPEGTPRQGKMADKLALATLKIADFGLARTLDESRENARVTASDAVLGTPSYMPPEQARGDSRTVGPAADIYSLGAVLYHCLTGRPPFQSGTWAETVLQVCYDDPPPLWLLRPGMPPDLENICLLCLHKQPNRRYPTADHLADDLERFLQHEPVLARPVGWLERSLKWMRRHPALTGALATTVVAGVGAGLGGVAYVRQLWNFNEQLRSANQEVTDQRDKAAALVVDLRAQTELTHQERQRAEQNLGVAKSAIQRSFLRVSNYVELREPRWQALRRELLADSLAYFRGFLAQASTDRQLRREQAQVARTLAEVLGVTDGPAVGLPFARQACATWADLSATDASAELQYERGVAETLRAGLARGAGQLTEAKTAYELALPLFTSDTVEARWQATACRIGLGLLALDAGQLDLAEQQLRPALGQASALARAHPDRAELVQAAQVAWLTYGAAQESAGRLPTAVLAYQTVAELAPEQSDPDCQLAHLTARVNWANVLLLQGQSPLAVLQVAEQLSEQLLKQQPGVSAYKHAAARVADAQGRAKTGKDAEIAYRLALKLHALLEPTSARHADHAACLDHLATHLAVHQQSGAEPLWEQAAGLLEPLTRAEPSNWRYAVQLAAIRINLGLRNQSARLLEQALAGLRPHLDGTTVPADVRRVAGLCAVSLAQQRIEEQQFAAAVALTQEASQRVANLRDADAVRIGQNALAVRAAAHGLAGQHTEALQAWETLLAQQPANAPAIRLALAQAHARSGDVLRASAAVPALEKDFAQVPEQYVGLAVLHALCLAALEADRTLPEGQRLERSKAHHTSALDWLRKASTAGLVRTPEQIERIRRNRDLAALHSSAPFRAWLAGLR